MPASILAGLETLGVSGPVILDGAVGDEIARRGGGMHDAAWCGVANRTHPEIVQAVHESYLRVGADIITANTFATARHVLAGAGLADQAPAITRRAVQIARQAIATVEPERRVLLAGSMSNTVAWLPGTFSPDPRYVPTLEEESDNYREMADALAEAGADLILVEMVLDVERATRAIEAAMDTGLPVWIGLSASLLEDGSVVSWDIGREESSDRIAAGQKTPDPMPFADLVDAMTALHPEVVGVMHTSAKATGPALEVLRPRWQGPVMAYPETTGSSSMSPADFARRARQWAVAGVRILGGCCGTTPSHLAALVGELDSVSPRGRRC